MQNSLPDSSKIEDLNSDKLDSTNENVLKLEVLSPLDKKDEPRVKKYIEHIKNAIDDSQVKNLAITGVYGSGKSTILTSFKSKYPDIKTLNISLASFKEIGSNEYKNFKDQIQLNIL